MKIHHLSIIIDLVYDSFIPPETYSKCLIELIKQNSDKGFIYEYERPDNF
ncbi:MAG: hypothetical protein JSC188_000914 [Candidatus Tokpelaia sp. JSC188]|nr:MAG: hypothetical protein JSC188_000914 [Candidatus Tokpelaia sp. JSC188]